MAPVIRKAQSGSEQHHQILPPVRWDLTAGEIRVVQSLATGLRPSEMARALGLSVHTVRTHLKRAMVKAGVQSQVALLARIYSAASQE